MGNKSNNISDNPLIDKVDVKYRFPWQVEIDKGHVRIVDLQKLIIAPIFSFITFFLLAFGILFAMPLGESVQIHFSNYTKPAAYLVEPFYHLFNWFCLLFVGIYKTNTAVVFSSYQTELANQGQLGYYILKFFIAVLIAINFSISKAQHIISNPYNPNPETIKRGMEILFNDDAAEYYNKLFEDTIKERGIAFGIGKLHISWETLTKHLFIVGASGSGKTQAIIRFVKRLIELVVKDKNGKVIRTNPIRLVILDPKNEFTPKFYDESNPGHVLIDLTDERSHLIDYKNDLTTPALIKKLACAIIPASKDPTWTNTPQNFLIALFLFLQDNFPAFSEQDFEDIYMHASWQEKEWIVNKYYPFAKDYLPPMRADGTYDESANPNASYRSTGHNYISNFIELGRYVKKEKKFFSVRDFMLNPNCPHKIVFIRINSDGGNAAQTLARSVLASMSGFIDSVEMPESKSPRHVFLFEEIAGAGKLVDENGRPILDRMLERARSKGGSVITIMQDELQIGSLYEDDKLIEKWKANCSTHITCGLNRTEGTDKLAERLGKITVEKDNKSVTYDKDMKSNRYGDKSLSSEERQAITSSELIKSLGARKGFINVLVGGIGINKILILKHKFKIIPAKPDNNFHKANILMTFQTPDTKNGVLGFLKQKIKIEKDEILTSNLKKIQNGEMKAADMSIEDLIKAKELLEKQQEKNEQAARKLETIAMSDMPSITVKDDDILEDILKDKFRDDYGSLLVSAKLSKRRDEFAARYQTFTVDKNSEFILEVKNILAEHNMPSFYKFDISICLRKGRKLDYLAANKILNYLTNEDPELSYLIGHLYK